MLHLRFLSTVAGIFSSTDPSLEGTGLPPKNIICFPMKMILTNFSGLILTTYTIHRIHFQRLIIFHYPYNKKKKYFIVNQKKKTEIVLFYIWLFPIWEPDTVIQNWLLEFTHKCNSIYLNIFICGPSDLKAAPDSHKTIWQRSCSWRST